MRITGTIVASLNDDIVQVKYANHLKWVHTDNPENFRMVQENGLTRVGVAKLEEIYHDGESVKLNLGWGIIYSPMSQVRFLPIDTLDCRTMFTQTQVKGILCIQVVQAFELPHWVLNKPTTYATLGAYVAGDEKDKQIFQSTHVVQKDPNPIYDDLLEFPPQRFDVNHGYVGTVSLYNYSMEKSDQLMATAEFPLPSKFDSPQTHVLTLTNTGENFGVIVLSACLIVAGNSRSKIDEIIENMKGQFAKPTTCNGLRLEMDKNMVNKSIRPISPIEQTKRSPQRSLNANLMASQNHEENQDVEEKRSLQQHGIEKKRSLQQHEDTMSAVE